MYQFGIAVFFAFTIRLTNAQTCHWPNGNVLRTEDDFVACAVDGESQCCESGHACLSNGLCFNPGKGAVYRGGCTDAKWSTDACPGFCNDMISFTGAAAPLQACPPDEFGNWNWWCGQDSENVCGTPDENTSIFAYPTNATIIRVASVQVSTPSTSSPVPAGTSSSSQPLDQPSVPTVSPYQRRSGDVPRIIPIAIGIGVGVPLSMLAITFAFFFWKERKRRILAEKLGYAGQAVAQAKQSYNVQILAMKPAQLKRTTSKAHAQRQAMLSQKV